jgi:hypothetical protein
MARHRWLSAGSGGSSRVSAWILNPAAAAATKIRAMMIQVIGRAPSSLPACAANPYGKQGPPGSPVTPCLGGAAAGLSAGLVPMSLRSVPAACSIAAARVTAPAATAA